MNTKRTLKFAAVFSLLTLIGCAEFNDPYYSRPSGGYNDPYYNSRYDDDYYDREADRARDARRDLERERRRLEEERRRAERERHDHNHGAIWQPSNPPPQRVQERCPAGFSPSEQKCSPQERKRGCRDIRLPGGLGCVSR